MIGSFKLPECFALCPLVGARLLSRWLRRTPRGGPSCRPSPAPAARPRRHRARRRPRALCGADGQIRAAGVQGVFHADVRVLSAAVLRARRPRARGRSATRAAGAGRHPLRLAGPLARRPRPRPDRPGRPDPHGRHGGLDRRTHRRSPRPPPAPVTATVTVDLALRPRPDRGGQVRRRRRPRRRAARRDADGDPGAGPPTASRSPSPASGPPRSGTPRHGSALAGRRSRRAAGTTADLAGAGRRPAAPWYAPPPVEAGGVVAPRVVADDRRLSRLVDPLAGRPASLRLRLTDRRRRHLPRRRACPGSSPCSAATASGRPGCCCRSAPTSPPARCGCWPAGRAPGRPATPARSPARSCTSCAGTTFALDGHGLRLPAAYYGTVDATPLWISLLHDAWRWGLPAAEVAALLPAPGGRARLARRRTPTRTATASSSTSTPAATAWPTRAGRTPATRVRFHDGRLGRAADRAGRGAGLRLRGGAGTAPRCWTRSAGPAATRWRELRRRAGRAVPRPVLGRRPDGRVPGAGPGRRQAPGRLADQQHRPPARHRPAHRGRGAAQVADLLGAPRHGRRLRAAHDVDATTPASARCPTTAARSGRTTPRSWSPGWPGAGFAAPRRRRWPTGCSPPAEAFDYRLPELFGGDDRSALGRPVPYPAACRPQAWSAAAAVTVAARRPRPRPRRARRPDAAAPARRRPPRAR